MKLIRRRSLQILISIGIGILLVAGALHLPAVQKQVVVRIGNWASETSGLHVELEAFHLHWWSGQIAMSGLKISSPDQLPIAIADEIRLGITLKAKEKWLVRGFEWNGGSVDVDRALNWYESQIDASEQSSTHLEGSLQKIKLVDVHFVLPDHWMGGGQMEVTLNGGQLDLSQGEWRVQLESSQVKWDERIDETLHRPAGSASLKEMHGSLIDDQMLFEVEEIAALGWTFQGSCELRNSVELKLEAARLDWKYTPLSGESWWSAFEGYDIGQNYWAGEAMSGNVTAFGHQISFSNAQLPAGISIQAPFELQWPATGEPTTWNGTLQVDLTDAKSWMDEHSADWSSPVPWTSLERWLGGSFEMRLESDSISGFKVDLINDRGEFCAGATVDAFMKESHLHLHQLNASDWELSGPNSVSLEVHLETAEGLWKDELLRFETDLRHSDRRFPEGSVKLTGLWDRSQQQAHGNVQITGKSLPMNLALVARYDSLRWEVAWDGHLDGVSPDAGSSVQLFADCSGTLKSQPDGSIGLQNFLRNSVLLHQGRPMTIERFDVFIAFEETQLSLRWESDLGVGDLLIDPDLTAWQDWWQALASREANAKMPMLQADLLLRRFKPVALLAQIPLELSDGTHIQGRNTSDGFTLQAASREAAWGDWRASGLNIQLDGLKNEIFANVSTNTILLKDEKLATDGAFDLHGDSVWTADVTWMGMGGADTRIRWVARDHDQGWDFRVYEASVPWLTDRLELAEIPARIDWLSGNQPALQVSDLHWTTHEARFEVTGRVDGTEASHLDVNATFTSLPNWAGLQGYGVDMDSAFVHFEACNVLHDPNWFISGELVGLNWSNQFMESLLISGDGDASGVNAWWEIKHAGNAVVNGSGRFPLSLTDALESTIEFHALPLTWLNPWLPEGTVELAGGVHGKTYLRGSLAKPELSGSLHAQNVTADIEYLGIGVTLDGSATLHPDYFAFDGWKVKDDRGTEAILTGTILHRNFEGWNFDLSLDANESPIHVMELTRKQNDLFYGRAFATGDANVSGYADNLVVEARLTTSSGTVFALPLDAASDARYADFITFYNPEVMSTTASAADLSRVRMDLALDITEDAEARIIFDESVGDELSGITRGALNLTIDDFERFTMNGQLEVIEGAYLFTLQNVINKRFTIEPGGTLTWFGDPYAAEIDLDAGYEVRTGLDPLLPQETNLPGRTKVNVEMGMLGNLMRPTISFGVQVPEVDGRLQALVNSALINEEELNRQVMGLLVLQQFLSPDPTAAIGTTGLQDKSTEFLASQIGFWLSQLTQDVNVGLDYGTDAKSGEQALAVALSAQLLDDRLHVEGAVGTNHLFSGSTQDLQVQDIRVKYDLPPDGTFQVTGYTSTSPDIAGTTGSTTQGVGVLMQSEFDSIGEFWRRIWRRMD